MSGSRQGRPETVSAADTLEQGLSPLDQERAESMASEGGHAAQARSGHEALPAAEPSLLPARPSLPWWLALSLGVVVGYLGYRGLRRAA